MVPLPGPRIYKPSQLDFMEVLHFFVVVVVLFFVFRDRVSLYSPGCPGTHFVDQAGLELRNSPASASRLGLKVCTTTTPSFFFFFFFLVVVGGGPSLSEITSSLMTPAFVELTGNWPVERSTSKTQLTEYMLSIQKPWVLSEEKLRWTTFLYILP
jgi:hypothetical protein